MKSITTPFYSRTAEQCAASDLSIFQRGYSESLEYYDTFIRDIKNVGILNYLSQ